MRSAGPRRPPIHRNGIDPSLAAGRKSKKVESDEVIAVIRRVLAENGRSYIPHYAVAVALLLLVAGTTAFTAWIMRDVINEIFYNQRFSLIAPICGAIIAAFVIRGLADYGQAVLLAKIGNNLVARYQRRVFDHLMKLGVGFFT
jgi:ATP-binding cassette, subfamily B, bacterial MsbA